MSTIDEVLAAAEVVDAVCVIDGETRIISVPNEYKELGVESDEKVTRVKFQCPKIVGDNIDLTEYNLYINYRNAGNKLNSYLVEDVTVTGDIITFSWLLSRHVTESPGTISYIVCAKKSDDTGVINEWNTKVATGTVGIGLEATEEIEEQNIDAIEQILKCIVDLENKVDSGGSANPDWNQNDNTQPDYIKNRPFYTGDTMDSVIVEESSITFSGNSNGTYSGSINLSTFVPEMGETYKVSWDGTVYECQVKLLFVNIFFGNISIVGQGTDTGEPFLIEIENGAVYTKDTSASHTISISQPITPVVKIDKKYIYQPDWNQNDETAADYVKNRPFYTTPPETLLVEATDVIFVNTGDGFYMSYYPVKNLEFIPGNTYKVSWDGTLYTCESFSLGANVGIGNLSLAAPDGADTGEPFLMGVHDGLLMIQSNPTSTTHSFSIRNVDELVVKIDEKYLSTMPNPDKLTFTGAVSAEYDGSGAVTIEIPTVPSSLPNPNKLTFTGAVSADYDGTNAVSVEIPSRFKPEGNSYLTFSSPNSFTLKVNDTTKHWDGTLEYFASNRIWTTWDGTTTLSSVDNDGDNVLYMRGTGNTVITGSGPTYRWILTGEDISCIGNIENILDHEIEYPTMSLECYRSMFEDCTSLIKAPELPSTNLSAGCYRSMFKGCTSLIEAPILPAIIMRDKCYEYMFYGCTSLTKAPALPANSLADSCYSYMFGKCNRLTQAPFLPASVTKSYCYAGMFSGCISLTKAPVLPATDLSDGCYGSMFDGCTRLIQAPALPATTLASGCYAAMFRNCVSLTTAPSLPATSLTNTCYNKMFYNCARLTQIPAINADISYYRCCREMFYLCSSLKISATKTEEYTQEYRIPMTGTGTAGAEALTDMFVDTGGTFTGTPEVNTTYYISNDNMIVHDTEIATLREFVKSILSEVETLQDYEGVAF